MYEEEDISREEKKKPRRVSFSDTTSVLFFNRDEDYETPPENHAPTPQKQAKEFFGPVSLWHIGSEGAEQSPLENDITLDSTEFSQHFSKLLLVQKENFKQVCNTPTGESTKENLMSLTDVLETKPHPDPVQPTMDEDSAADMSLTGENPSEYKFATISPDLVALMANKESQVQFNNFKVDKPGCSMAGTRETSRATEQGKRYTSEAFLGKSQGMNYWESIDLKNEQGKTKCTNDCHELPNSDSSSVILSSVNRHIPVVNNKVSISSGSYLLPSTNGQLDYHHKGPEMVANGSVQGIKSVSMESHNPIVLTTDNLSHDYSHYSECCSQITCHEEDQNQEFSVKWQGKEFVKTLQPLLSSSFVCVRNRLENLYHQHIEGCDNPTGNILKLKKNQTEESLTVEPNAALEATSSNTMDELGANCKDHMAFDDVPPNCLKNENIDPSGTVKLKDQDKETALHTEICPDENRGVACKLNDLTGSVQNYCDLAVALNNSLPNRNISLKRSILSPITLNLEDTRPESTVIEIKATRKAHEYRGVAQEGFTTKTDFVSKMFPPSPLITNISCEQMEQQNIPGHLTTHMPKEVEPMLMQQARRDISHKTHEGKYIPETDFSTRQADKKENNGKENRSQILDLHDRTPSINISKNGSLSHESKLEESSITGLSLEHIPKSSIHPAEKQSLARTDLQKHTEMAPMKLIEVPRKFPVGVQEFYLPVITKPRTLQECLSFMYATRPQMNLLEDTVEQLQKDIANMKTSSKMKNQVMDAKDLLAMKNKPWVPENFRMGHIKWLQQMLAYENSKLQLLLAKEDELKKTVQSLQLGFQEVEKLKDEALCLDKKAPFRKQNDWSIQKPATDGEKKAHIQSLKVDIENQIKSFASKKDQAEEKLKEAQRENLACVKCADSMLANFTYIYFNCNSIDQAWNQKACCQIFDRICITTNRGGRGWIDNVPKAVEWQDTCEKVIIMKQELNVLDSKIRDLCEFYSAICTGHDISKKEVIRSLECNVKSAMKKIHIRQDMLLWKLKDIKSKPGEHFIELNYLDIISQSFSIDGDEKLGKASASYSISYENVERVFPFMNASMAFDAIFASKKSFKAVDIGGIWKTIQEMSFLFGTLIDVLQEIQLCRTKLRNLSFARFHCVDGSQLHLQLTFLKYTYGLKVVVVLDMKDLKYGIYPYDVFPFQVELAQHGQQSKCLLSAEDIEESMKSLTSGYSRLRMLCDCISNLMECKE